MGKDFEKKYLKLKKKHKSLKELTKASLHVIIEAAKKRKALLEKDKPIEQKAVTFTDGKPGTYLPKQLGDNTIAEIVIEDEYLWLSEILAGNTNIRTEAVAKFFIGQLGIRDIRAKGIASVKAETDGKDGKWIVLYTPFEEQNIHMPISEKGDILPSESDQVLIAS